jgi:hypothetical protein
MEKGPEMYCGRCGEQLLTGGGEPIGTPDAGPHTRCAQALELEPPRYCVNCRRRMIVQITPAGWSARCSEHGTLVS